MKNIFLLVIVTISLLGGCSKKSTAGEYKLVKGKEVLINGKIYPICKDFLKSLNSFKDKQPMVCEQRFNSKFGVVSPVWKMVSKENINWDILKQIYFSKNSTRFTKNELMDKWAEEKIRLEKLAQKKTILWSATFDIDNVKGEEKILKLADDDCSVKKYYESNAPDPSLHVLDDDGMTINDEYKRLDYNTFSVFKYKNHTYLTKWRGAEVKYSGAQLFVYDAFKPRGTFGFSTYPICEYEFIK